METPRKINNMTGRQRQEDIVRVARNVEIMMQNGEIDKGSVIDLTARLLELSPTTVKRIDFLRNYMEYKKSSILFVFLDETWIFSKGAAIKTWQDGTLKSCKQKGISNGKRFVIIHAGTRYGFVNDADLIFSSNNSTGDYHGELNGEKFERWLRNVLDHLEEPSLIVMDNASYHSVQSEPCPTGSWTKPRLQEWLQMNNIPYNLSALKTELYALTLLHRSPKRYKVDEIINESGHRVLRLPPYHCHYNPIELVWGECKRYYNRHVGRGQKYDDATVKETWKEALSQITPEKWNSYVEHSERLIREDWEIVNKEDSLNRIEPIVIPVDEDTEDSEDEGL